MGALTGLLCDVAKSVVSIEMSETRASIIRARYPNRKNLSILSENILDWKEERKFDYVVFVGVLEYAAVFSESKNPFVEFLQAACSHLKPDGVLLFAIENRFGLKYWLGGSEDHLQKPFVGIEGYKEKKTAQTFSKETLRKFCSEAGLKQTRFYSVYPDYKFPEIICVEGYKPNAENLRKVHFTYSRNSLLYVDERDLYRELVENNVSDFFANSFLIEASLSTLSDVYPVFAVGKGEVKKNTG
jgi:SAM-dependent methyltransferase